MGDQGESSVGLIDASGALLMLDKDERWVVKELLILALQSETIKNYLKQRAGNGSKSKSGRKKRLPHGYSDYTQVAENLLKNMGHKLPGKSDGKDVRGKKRSIKDQKKNWIKRKDGSYTLEDSSIFEIE